MTRIVISAVVFTFFAACGGANFSSGANGPAAPTNVRTQSLSTQGEIKLEWQNPEDADFQYALVLRVVDGASILSQTLLAGKPMIPSDFGLYDFMSAPRVGSVTTGLPSTVVYQGRDGSAVDNLLNETRLRISGDTCEGGALYLIFSRDLHNRWSASPAWAYATTPVSARPVPDYVVLAQGLVQMGPGVVLRFSKGIAAQNTDYQIFTKAIRVDDASRAEVNLDSATMLSTRRVDFPGNRLAENGTYQFMVQPCACGTCGAWVDLGSAKYEVPVY